MCLTGLTCPWCRRPMLFPTFTFAVFFLAVYGTHVLLRAHSVAWKLAMVAASATFYGWWDWRFCGLIAASIVLNWTLASLLGRTRNQNFPFQHLFGIASDNAIVALGVIVNLGVLGFFKYYGFFALSFLDLVGADPSNPPIPLLDIVLPVGISFFTFQALSYVIDVYRRKLDPAGLLDVAVYLSFFPQLVAGPIVRASEFLPQLTAPSRPERVPASEAVWLIGRGLFKKVVISTYLASAVVDPAFAAANTASRQELWFGMYGYAIQIYADFSGYTDIAIGLALLLGFRFPTNFDNPYRSQSIQEFWRRWHQTLSRWLRDYLYIPLGGSHGGKTPTLRRVLTYRNLLLTMVLGGLWHGAAWTFVVWGSIHGGALAIERLARESKRVRWRLPMGPRATKMVRWFVTFHVVCLAWIFFRAASFELAVDYLRGLVRAEWGDNVSWLVVAIIVGALVVQLTPTRLGATIRPRLAGMSPPVQGGLLGLWIALIVALGPQGVAPFIYFQF